VVVVVGGGRRVEGYGRVGVVGRVERGGGLDLVVVLREDLLPRAGILRDHTSVPVHCRAVEVRELRPHIREQVARGCVVHRLGRNDLPGRM
jgi:hypothetical protein